MLFALSECRPWLRRFAPFALLTAVLSEGSIAYASQSTFRSYDTDQGLASLGGACMIQDRVGYLLVCTEHGVFAYDGRRFANLGPEQGLRLGGEVFDLATSAAGRVAIRFAEELYVSEQPADISRAPSELRFEAVAHPGIGFYDEKPHHLVSWRGGFVLLAGETFEKVSAPESGPATIETMDFDPGELKLLKGGLAVFSVRGKLWETFDHGRVCAANPGAVKCFTPGTGQTAGQWFDIVEGTDGGVLARSATSVASFNAKLGQWSVIDLPDQGVRYDNYQGSLGLFRTPDGQLFTQADHGLALLTPSGWRVLSVEDGAPFGTIVGSMIDATGQFWLRVLGAGLVRWVGYGHWETVSRRNGLSEGFPWQTARARDGSLWVSTDTAADEIVRTDLSLRVSRVLPGSSFAMAAGPHGTVWRGSKDGVKVFDPTISAETKIDVPPVYAIVISSKDIVWLGTQKGLFRVDDSAGAPSRPVLEGSPHAQVVNLVSDGLGGVYYLASGRLRHLRLDETDVPVAGAWPTDGFEPGALAIGLDGAMWIGGSGGLYRFTVLADNVVKYQPISISDIRTNTIDAVMIDHKGWVWIGTALGVSVYDGQRWVSIDADSGLLSNDVDEGGIREDSDGSVWVTTTQGVSHLLDPKSLFSDRPIRAVVSSAELGGRPVLGSLLPFTKDALSVQFGTPSYGSERSVRFRYHLSGVDSGEVESTTGFVRYAFVPPGHHLLTVVGYDELTHRSSKPATLAVDINYPWWRQWWAEALWASATIAILFGIMRFRLRAMLAGQQKLKKLVAEATEQLRFDRLTGLFNRCEIEERLAQKLSKGTSCSELVVALLDIDHFKRINDSYGHLGGDDVLRAMGRLMLNDIWEGEYAGRYGGEEILLVLDDEDGRAAGRVLHLLHSIRGTPFNASGHSIRVTCSIGLAWAVPGDDWDSLIGRADNALYEAKSSGRDQVTERRSGNLVMRDHKSERGFMPGRSAGAPG